MTATMDRTEEIATTRTERAMAELANNQRVRIEALEAELRQLRRLLEEWRDMADRLNPDRFEFPGSGLHWLATAHLPSGTADAVWRIDRLLAAG